MKSIKKIFVVLAVAMLMFSMGLATSYGVNVPSNDKKNTGITIESQSKTVSYKITWNGNGGKIGSKKTTITNIKKGSKIGKLATTPKRNGYTFKGWYTKKTGGTKITKNTKPTKSTSYFAQWNKKLNAAEKKLIGLWVGEKTDYEFNYDINDFDKSKPTGYYFRSIKLNADGTFTEITSWRYLTQTPVYIYNDMCKGLWTASGEAINFVVIDRYQGSDKDRKMWSIIPPDGSYRANNMAYGYQYSKNINYDLSSNRKSLSTSGSLETVATNFSEFALLLK